MRRLTSGRRSDWCVAALLTLALVLPTATMAAKPKSDEVETIADEVISLPLRELGIVIDREHKGVYLPYSELLKLWELAREKAGEVQTPPPATHVIRSTRLVGTLEDDAIALTATLNVELLTDEWTTVELGLSGVAISRALDGDGPLAIRETPTGPRRSSSRAPVPTAKVAELRGKGAHTITVEGLVPLEEKGTRFAFTVPRAALSLVELSIPSGRKLEIAGALLTGSETAGDMTRRAFLLGNVPEVSGTLSAADEEPRAPGVLYVRTDTAVGFRQDVMETLTRITVTVRNKPIETLSVIVPGNVKVASVAGEAVSHWDVAPADGGQRVVIRLARRVVDRASLELRTEAFYDRTNTVLDVPIPVVEDATDTRGVIGVGRAPEAGVFVASTDGMVPAARAELALQHAAVGAVYRFREQPVRMVLGLEWPVRRFRVFETTLLDVERDVLRLDTVLTVTPTEGTLFDLGVALPPRYEILDVVGAIGGQERRNASGGLKIDWDIEQPEDPAAPRILHVRLPHKVEAPQALVVVINARKMPQADLTAAGPGARMTEPLAGFVVRGAERQTGIIGVAADPSYLVEDEATSGLVPAPIEELNAAGLAGAGLRFGYTYRRPPVAADLVVSRKRPVVHAATATTVAVHGDVIDVLALTEFSIWYSTLNDVLLRLPASVDPANVEITGDDIRDRHLLTPDEVRALGQPAEAHIWRITLDVGKTGIYVLSAAYQVKVAAGDATNRIPLLDYGAMPELEADRGFVAIIANREIELATEIGDPRLREMDKADLPTRLFPSTPVARVLFAYQYPKPPEAEDALGLVVRRHEPAAVLPALVEAAEVFVCVSHRDGAFTEARYKVLNSEEAGLRLRLPAGSVLWAVLVDGTETKAREQKDEHGTVYVVPLKATTAPGQSQQVVVRYWSAMPKLKRGGGTYTVKLPAFDNLHVGRANLTIFQPDEYRFIRFGGNMNVKAEVKTLPLLVRWFAATDEALEGPFYLAAPVVARAREQARRWRPAKKYPEGEGGGGFAEEADEYEETYDAVAHEAGKQAARKADSALARGDYKEATRQLKEAVRVTPEPFNDEYLKRLAEVHRSYVYDLLRNGKYAEASAEAQDFLARFTDQDDRNVIEVQSFLQAARARLEGKREERRPEEPTSAARQQIVEKLNTTIHEVDFVDAELREVINFLAREADVNIVIDPVVFQSLEGGPDAEPEGRAAADVTMQLKDAPLKDVLKYTLAHKGLKYVVEDYAILVIPRDYVLPEELETEIFRLSDGAFTQTVNGKAQTIDNWLKRAGGVTWPRGSSLTYHEPTHTLIVTSTPTNMHLVRELVRLWDEGARKGTGVEIPGALVETIAADSDEPVLAGGIVRPPGEPADTGWWIGKGTVRGLLSLDIEVPAEGVEVPFDRLSGGGEVVVRYASSNGMGRTQTIAIVLTMLIAYWLRKLLGWSRTGLVLFLAAACTIGPGLSNYWMTPYWDMITKGVLLLIPVFVIDYVVARVGRRRVATALAALLLVALVVPGAVAKEPVEPSAVIEEGGKRIYIPFTQVERAKLGDNVGVFIALDEFIRLWERAHPEAVIAKAPRPYALTNAVYHGRIGEKGVAFTASFDIAVLNDVWTAVPLPFDRIAIEKATLDGAEAPLTMIEGAPTLVFEKAGRHKLELGFALPISGVMQQGGVHLAMPPAEAALLEIEAPVEELEFRTDAARPGTTIAGDGSTLYRAPVGGLTRLNVSWRQKGLALAVGRAIFHNEATMRLYVDERLILGELTSTVTLVRGQLEGLAYEVPAGATILNVAGEGLADWRLEKADGAGVLAVEFVQPVTRQVRLVVDVAVERAGLGTPIAFPDLPLRGAQSERGSIELYARHGLDLTITDSAGLEPKLKPRDTRTLAETGLTYEPRVARSFPRRPFSLTFEARRTPDDWTALVGTLYTVLEPRTLLESHLHLEPESGSIFELLVEVPAGFAVLEISGAPVADWRLADAAKNTVAVRLRDEQTVPFDVRLVAERLHDEMPAAFGLGVPRVLNTAHQYGILAVAFDQAWDIVEPRLAEGMHAIRAANTPGWMRPAGAPPVRYAASYRLEAVPTVAFGLRQAETQLSATLAHHLSVFTDEVSLRVLVAYSVDGKPVRELKFTAPAALRDELRVVGLELRGPAKRTGQTADGRDIWTVQFHSPVAELASFEVRWRGEIPANRELKVPRIGAVDAGVQTVFVSVENLSANEVTASTWPGLTKLPVEQVPVVPPNTRLASIALAYRSVEPQWSLGLSLVSYEVAHLIPAQILSARFETVVDDEGGARTRMTLRVRNRTQQFLRVTFPDPIELWALSVGGEPAQPSRATGNTYLLPMIKSGLADLPFDVVATYSHRIGGPKRPAGRRFAWSGSFSLVAPEIEGLPTNRTVWELWLPQGYRTLEFGGNTEQIDVGRSLAEQLEDVAQEYEQQRAIAERTKGKAQQQALSNLQQIENRYANVTTAVNEELALNEALLKQENKTIWAARNVSRGELARQQRLSKHTIESAAQTFARNRDIAERIADQAELQQQAQQQAEGKLQTTINRDSLSNWAQNITITDDLESKELKRATEQEQKAAGKQKPLDAKKALGDRSTLESVERNVRYDKGRNAAFFYTTDAREAQRRLGGLEPEQPEEPTVVWTEADADAIRVLTGQWGYVAHRKRVTTQAIRPEARSLAFDIPREGRLFVFSKVNAEAKIEVRQLRASTWHGLKTVGGLILLALVAWAVDKAGVAGRVRRHFGRRPVLGVFVGLTALLVLVALVGRFRYGAVHSILVLAAIAWAVYWAVRRSARLRKAAPAQAVTEDEVEEE
jgi:hypothetical protein